MRYHRENATADTAFGRQPDAIGKVPCPVILAASQHQRVDAPDPVRLLRSDLSLVPTWGKHQISPRERKLPACESNGALPYVRLHDVVNIMLQVVEGFRKIGLRTVVIASLCLPI